MRAGGLQAGGQLHANVACCKELQRVFSTISLVEGEFIIPTLNGWLRWVPSGVPGDQWHCRRHGRLPVITGPAETCLEGLMPWPEGAVLSDVHQAISVCIPRLTPLKLADKSAANIYACPPSQILLIPVTLPVMV